MNAILWISKLVFFFALAAELLLLELSFELALDHVSLEHIFAVVLGATDSALEGPKIQ